MSSRKGIIVLMGSGELTATMVEVHKEVLARLGDAPKAVFLDTPAGFQVNADQLSQRAVEYFRTNVGCTLVVSSFKSKDVSPLEAERSFQLLKSADYMLVGPGSPTYALRQWKETPIPMILEERIRKGACIVAASAAALTLGRFTLPVYEIYKVGQELHWVAGMDILGHLGLNILVVPHWNNAEGGTHDTRFCFMGEGRYAILESMLPEDVRVLGIDEHTACVIDFDTEEMSVKGIGSVTLRGRTFERIFRRGGRFPLKALSSQTGSVRIGEMSEKAAPTSPKPVRINGEETFLEDVHDVAAAFQSHLEGDPRDAANALLNLERLIWQAQQKAENPELIAQTREILRESIVLLGTCLASARSAGECLAPLVEELLALRDSFREKKQWQEADAIRDCLRRVNIEVDDTAGGHQWRLHS